MCVAQSRLVLEEGAGFRYRPSGGINTWRRVQRFLFNIFVLFITVAAAVMLSGCLCRVMLTADWSWRGNVLYFMNVTLRRGDGEKKR